MTATTAEGGARDKVFWTVGSLAIAAVALLPVAWILSLSLKPESDFTDGRFIPKSVTFDNYREHLRPVGVHRGAAQLDRHRAHLDGPGGGARDHVRIRDRPTRLPR